MSRTDKDRPYRVRAADFGTLREHHARCCERAGGPLPCDIDAAGIRTRCYRTGMRQRFIWWLTPCPGDQDYREWTRPDRQRTRLALREAARDFNANRETEVEPPTEQHRHRTRYDCW